MMTAQDLHRERYAARYRACRNCGEPLSLPGLCDDCETLAKLQADHDDIRDGERQCGPDCTMCYAMSGNVPGFEDGFAENH